MTSDGNGDRVLPGLHVVILAPWLPLRSSLWRAGLIMAWQMPHRTMKSSRLLMYLFYCSNAVTVIMMDHFCILPTMITL